MPKKNTPPMSMLVTDPPALDGLGRPLCTATANCIECNKVQQATAPIEDVTRWRKDRLAIQDVFPEMDKESREVLIQIYAAQIYICSDCQAAFWGDDWRPE